MKIRITKDYIIFIFYYLLSFILNVLRLITIRQAQKKTHSAVEFFVPAWGYAAILKRSTTPNGPNCASCALVESARHSNSRSKMMMDEHMK